MKVNFRLALLYDVPSIIELCNECFFENTSLEYAINSFKNTMNSPNDIYLVGEVDDKIIAHSKITIIETMYEKMNVYAILNHVCVKEEYRRHNIATLMLKEIERICRLKKVKTMELWSNNVRVPAHACYKKYGFGLDDAGFFSKPVE